MVLDIIKSLIEKYKELILTNPDYDELYKWESLKTFQDRWNIDEDDFHQMYDNSLKNSYSENLWASQFFYPKRVMLKFIELDQERVRSMFKNLFDEEKEIESRIDRFVFHCDELRDLILKKESQFQNHFHDGYRMISVYLCFRYPMQYTIYKYTEFKDFMEYVRAKSIPGTNEIDRFYKVMRTLYNILAEDDELLSIHRQIRNNGDYYQGESLLLAQDFYWCSSRYFIGG